MARPGSAARRYAEAAFELAARDASHDRWATDLGLAAAIVSDARVARVVDNPTTPLADRERLLTELLGSRIARPALNLVRLLDTRGRLALLPAIAAEFGRSLDRMRGIVAATVTSATPLETDETAALQRRIEAMTGQTVRLATAIDPALIGGLTVRLGDRMIDASVRGRLERLRDQLVAGSR
ncbi:MAG: F0F1 ATP synthase subunit delta [Chloroflexi bacterium]|nr:F0F1 ATP synthase subunit delta [Chloroflexota bacterium]